MSDIPPETPMPPEPAPGRSDRAVAIAAIIATTIVALACILACTITAYAFLVNAPW